MALDEEVREHAANEVRASVENSYIIHRSAKFFGVCNSLFNCLGSNSLVYGITTLLQKKIRQVYPVWSVLVGYIITLYSSKSYVKSWGVRPNFGEVWTPQWLHPWADTVHK